MDSSSASGSVVEWVAIGISIVALIVSVAVAVRTSRRQEKLTLYEKRHGIYKAISKFISGIPTTNRLTDQRLFDLMKVTAEAKFICGDVISGMIERIYREGVELSYAEEMLQSLEYGSAEYMDYAEDKRKSIESLREIQKEVEEEFRKIIKL